MNPLEPMLATEYTSENQLVYPCFVQPKLDGIRAIWTEGKLWSRGLVGGQQKVFSDKVLGHIYAALREKYPNAKLDGELYVHGWSLQRINSAAGVNRKSPTSDSALIQYHIYDVPETQLSFTERFYDRIFLVEAPLRVIEAYQATVKQQADDMFKFWLERGYEGLIYRVGRCNYCPGIRSPYLLKRKLWKDCIGNVVHYTIGKNRLSKTLGAVIVRAEGIKAPFSVGSGFTDKQRNFLWNTKPEILNVKIRYERLTDGGVPYKPTLIEIL